MRILLAEDAIKVAQHVRQGLVAEGYAVDIAADGEEALWLLHPIRGVGFALRETAR